MICVTGASGTVGREVVKQLGSADVPFRGAYHSGEKANAANERGIDTVLVDFSTPETLVAGFSDCDKLFLLGPNVVNQAELEIRAVEAARSAGIGHIVKLSVFGAPEEAFELANIHRRVEKAIESSGLRWTFLRPNSFMQNSVTFMGESIRGGSAFFSTSGEAKISHVDVRDIAAVAVKALTDPAYEGKGLTLTGPEALSYEEIAAAMSAALGRTISHVTLPPSDLRQGMLEAGMPEPIADLLLDLERFYREDGASPVTDEIRRVTGREPGRFADFIREAAAKGVWDEDSKGATG